MASPCLLKLAFFIFVNIYSTSAALRKINYTITKNNTESYNKDLFNETSIDLKAYCLNGKKSTCYASIELSLSTYDCADVQNKRKKSVILYCQEKLMNQEKYEYGREQQQMNLGKQSHTTQYFKDDKFSHLLTANTWQDGSYSLYLSVIFIDCIKPEIKLVAEIHNKLRYFSPDERDEIIAFQSMVAIYSVVACCWLFVLWWFRREVLKIHIVIFAALLMALFQYAFMYNRLRKLNDGVVQEDTAFNEVSISVVVLLPLRRTIGKMLMLKISMHNAITKPMSCVGRRLLCAIAVGVVYFTVNTIFYSFGYFQIIGGDVLIVFIILLAIAEIFIYCWIIRNFCRKNSQMRLVWIFLLINVLLYLGSLFGFPAISFRDSCKAEYFTMIDFLYVPECLALSMYLFIMVLWRPSSVNKYTIIVQDDTDVVEQFTETSHIDAVELATMENDDSTATSFTDRK